MTVKPCGMAAERLQEYLDRALGRLEREKVEAHLRACRVCAQEVRSLQGLFARLSALPLFTPDPDFDRIVLSAVLTNRRRVLGVSPLGWFAAAYFVFTLGLLAVALVMAGVDFSGGPVAVASRFGQEGLHALARGAGALAVALQFLRDVGGRLIEVLQPLGRLPLLVAMLIAESTVGRSYLALSAFTALAFFLLSARRSVEGGVRHVRI
ncbi:MAG TPA: zf-HC2 domain-containing protein [Candidatus Saccharimonadales bacterium]|nr:zf-HC2 domain-containing protein [Candidatus Saccharimonadales bacterium]